MDILRKYPWEVVATLAIVILFFATRLYNILHVPIFTDEAIYLRWAQYLKGDPKFWDYALTDGKQPFYIWLVTVFLFLIKDPLIAGRIASVFAGMMSVGGLFFLGREVFKNKWVGFSSALLYVVYPFALVYDRMALYDTLVGTFAVWGLFVVVRFVRKTSLRSALAVAFVGGLGALNKSNNFFTILLLPFSLVLFDLKAKHWQKRFMRWIILSMLAAVIAYGIYSILRLSPYFHIIDQKNGTFVYPITEWIHHPFTFFWGNLWVGQRDWFIKYFGYPFLFFVFASFVIKKTYIKEKIVLMLWFLIPFLILALFGRTLYPRYIFFMTLSLLPMVAYTMVAFYERIRNPFVFIILGCVVFANPVWNDYKILTNFSTAFIPTSDIDQYYNDWPAGTGVKESVAFFEKESVTKQIAVFTEGTFGLMPYAYELYLLDNNHVTVQGFWPVNEKALQTVMDSAKKMPTYVVYYQPCPSCTFTGDAPDTWPLEKIMEFKKGKPDTYLIVYKVKQ